MLLESRLTSPFRQRLTPTLLFVSGAAICAFAVLTGAGALLFAGLAYYGSAAVFDTLWYSSPILFLSGLGTMRAAKRLLDDGRLTTRNRVVPWLGVAAATAVVAVLSFQRDLISAVALVIPTACSTVVLAVLPRNEGNRS